MSYAKAAGSCAGSGVSTDPRPRLFNEMMVVSMVRGFTYEDLAKELNKVGIGKFVSGYQKVDFNRRIALVIDDNKIRDLLVERGLKVNGIHVTFACHRRRDPLTRVYVSQLPIGILPAELKEAFAFFGEISEVNSITKIIHHIDTRDRVLVFKRLARHILSYVFVRGWRGFVKYTGHPLTCRICGLTGHFAKSTKKSNTEDNRSENVPTGQSESQHSEKNHPENKSADTSTSKPPVPEPASEANFPATMEAESVIPPPAEFRTRNLQEIRDSYMNCFGSVGSALSEDREDDLVSVDSLTENISDLIPPPDFPPKALDILNVKNWENFLKKLSQMMRWPRTCLKENKLGLRLRTEKNPKFVLSLTVFGVERTSL